MWEIIECPNSLFSSLHSLDRKECIVSIKLVSAAFKAVRSPFGKCLEYINSYIANEKENVGNMIGVNIPREPEV